MLPVFPSTGVAKFSSLTPGPLMTLSTKRCTHPL